MRKHGSIPRTVLGALVAATLGATSGTAWAQDCTTAPNNGAVCFHLKGSDTLFDIMTDAINAARTAGIAGSNNLFYDGSGSGNAESQMRFVSATGTQPGGTANLGVQSIGPMSRNFRPGVIDNLSVGFNQRAAGNLTGNGHAGWAPSCTNVVGLDAAVLLTRATGNGAGCRNVNFNTFNDNSFPGATVPRATTNNTALPVLFGNGGAFNNLAATSNYSNLLMIVLAGVDGSGSIAACSDPRRIQALQDLAGCMGVDHIEHLYRRDDNSGTTDTWKDRIMTISSAADPRYAWIGGRFCNNQSIGGINGAANQTGICAITRTTSCVANSPVSGSTDCPLLTGSTINHEACQFNLNNQDFDPIRRGCVAPDGAHAPTSCTDMTTGLACQASDGNPNCTQGLIVAITDFDPGSTDETTSIAARVKNDSSGQSIGYAGREAIAPGRGTKGFLLNTIASSDVNTRKEAYLLARRLFLQNGGLSGTTNDDLVNDLAGPGIGTIVGQGATQFTAEQNFFNWATNHANIDSIVKSRGFITCAPNVGDDPCALSNNLCAKVPAAPVAAPLSALVPNGSAGSGGTGGAKTIRSDGLGPSGAAITCAAGAACVGGTCTAGLTCPVAAKRASNSACTQNSDCTSNVCTDVLGIGVPGSPISLLCQ